MELALICSWAKCNMPADDIIIQVCWEYEHISEVAACNSHYLSWEQTWMMGTSHIRCIQCQGRVDLWESVRVNRITREFHMEMVKRIAQYTPAKWDSPPVMYTAQGPIPFNAIKQFANQSARIKPPYSMAAVKKKLSP